MPKRTHKHPTPQEVEEKYNLDEIDQKILKLKLEHPSITDSEIGAVVGLGREAVNTRRKRKSFLDAYTHYLQPAKSRIQQLVDKAARVYEKLLNSKDEKIQRLVAKDILISEAALKNRVDITSGDSEPLIIRKAKEIIEVHPVKPKQLPKGEK